MPTGSYSERLVVAYQTTIGSYIVPAGQRVVIKCITCWNNGGTATGAGLNIADHRVWNSSVAGGDAVIAVGLHLVAYAGERVELTNINGACNMTAHGYRFTEKSGP